MKILTILGILLLALPAFGQKRPVRKPAPAPVSVQTATTKDGRTVLLKSDGTWEYTNDPVVSPTPQPSPTPLPTDSGAAPAIKALRRMAAATEVGINFTEYGRRVIDLKGEVDEATAGIKNEELKSEIDLSLSAYIDAGQAWNRLLGGGGRYSEAHLFPDSDPFADSLQKKYLIPTEVVDPGANVPAYLRKTAPAGALQPFRAMGQSTILNTIWAAAKLHLERAESLLPK